MRRVDPSPSPSSRPSAPRTAPSGAPAPQRPTVASMLAQPAPGVAATGAVSIAPRKQAAWMRPTPLLVGSAALLGVDLALAITPRASAALTVVETLLVPAWVAAVVSLERLRKALAGARVEARRPRLALFLLAFVLLLACLGEKWLLVLGQPAEVLGQPVEAVGQPAAAPGQRGVALYRTYTVLAFLVALGGLLGRRPLERLLAAAAEHPARLMMMSFAVATLLGSFLLTLPQSLRDIAHASFIDGLFMSASAVCVTGLAVHNVAATYTPFGQAVLLLLVQVGGLGIMVLSTFFAIVAGRRLRLRDAAVMAEMIDAESFARLRRNVAAIVLFTLFIEAVGALALLFSFLPHHQIASGPVPGEPLSGAGDHLWAAVFHSVSAFCNAGFSLFGGGLVPLVGSPAVSAVVAALVILGSLGFPVHDELLSRIRLRLRGERPPRLSLHSRVVLLATAALLVAGTAGYLLLEARRSMAGLSWPVKVMASFFQSAMTRSAGLNTVDYSLMGPATWMLACILMFIGGGPGSTAGGVKLTTFAALLAALRAELRGEEAPRLLGRTLPAATVRRALGVAFLSMVLVAGLLLVLLVLEPHNPMGLALEAVSAFATAGLSANITPSLSAPGKLAITVAMFIGRIGPLTLALALANQARARSYRLPEERVGIG
ncbi:TrkH family potassium uptake protein [Sorangium sp. So ce394]|uniref:TrkH family potassium uptake protein n=1 Tax=Sorangium sp. So ce394 TaxID=3133310 RepID=UPI003F5B2323